MNNIPEIKIGVVAVSRDCFPIELSTNRRMKLVESCKKSNVSVKEIKVVVENEKDVAKALEEIESQGINSLVVYLGNFGPEGPETILMQRFKGPVMVVGAAEEKSNELIGKRGDAYCGMLNASYNIGLRKLNPYVPLYPIGTPEEIASMILDFCNISKVIIGISKLKIFGFGPRPHDFLACNAPIKPLYDLGIEIMENSELDLFESFNKHKSDKRIPEVVKDMEKELGAGNKYPEILEKLAQFELTLLDWIDNNKGLSEFVVFANKCWPAFQTQFGFVPCYVNSRLASKGIPVACETDIYGALSEYIAACATSLPSTILDINNTVPEDLFTNNKVLFKDYKLDDLFMGFHCGNTPNCHLKSSEMKYQLIMHRLLEPDSEPDISRGTLEGQIRAGDITIFRLQSTADGLLKSYIAEGEVIDVDTMSFGGIGVFAINEMKRFYRHVLISKRFPHHTGVAFKKAGKILFESLNILGVNDISFNQPKSMLYKDENPFV